MDKALKLRDIKNKYESSASISDEEIEYLISETEKSIKVSENILSEESDPSEAFEFSVKFINMIPSKLGKEKKRFESLNNERQDLLHAIELTTFNACEGYDWARQLKENALERRRVKDNIDLLKRMNTFANTGENRKFLDNLNAALKNVKTKKNHMKDRRYFIRERKDLKDVFFEVNEKTMKKGG